LKRRCQTETFLAAGLIGSQKPAVLECLTLTRSAELLLERRLVRLMNVEGFAKLLEITRNYTRYHAYGRRRLCEITRNYV